MGFEPGPVNKRVDVVTHPTAVPNGQVGFIKVFLTPFHKAVSELFESMQPLKELVDINYKHWESEVKRMGAVTASPPASPPEGSAARKSSGFTEGTTRSNIAPTTDSGSEARKKRLDSGGKGSSKSAIVYTRNRKHVTPRDAENVRAKSSGSMGLHLRSRTTHA